MRFIIADKKDNIKQKEDIISIERDIASGKVNIVLKSNKSIKLDFKDVLRLVEV